MWCRRVLPRCRALCCRGERRGGSVWRPATETETTARLNVSGLRRACAAVALCVAGPADEDFLHSTGRMVSAALEHLPPILHTYGRFTRGLWSTPAEVRACARSHTATQHIKAEPQLAMSEWAVHGLGFRAVSDPCVALLRQSRLFLHIAIAALINRVLCSWPKGPRLRFAPVRRSHLSSARALLRSGYFVS